MLKPSIMMKPRATAMKLRTACGHFAIATVVVAVDYTSRLKP
jgi:hypothetical protein